jgi:hypothetical protein
MSAKRLTERVSAPFSGSRVDREAGTVANVLICGTTSANGREYPVAVFRRDYRKYEGARVNADHGREATVDRRLGWFSQVACGADGKPRGTLNLLKSHPLYERVMEAAERNPALFGFSHVAICRTKPGADGRDVVAAIESVESIDLVAEPATTKSLFEGTAPVAFTRRQLIEWLARHPQATTTQIAAARRLAETDGAAGMDMPALDAPPADETGPQDALDRAFLDAATSEMRDCMAAKGDPARLKKCLGKLKKMLMAHAEIVADDADTDDADAVSGGESRRVKAGAILEAVRALNPALATDAEIVAATPADKRDAVAARLKAVREVVDRPTSAGRGRISEGGVGAAGAPPTDARAFADWLASN